MWAPNHGPGCTLWPGSQHPLAEIVCPSGRGWGDEGVRLCLPQGRPVPKGVPARGGPLDTTQATAQLEDPQLWQGVGGDPASRAYWAGLLCTCPGWPLWCHGGSAGCPGAGDLWAISVCHSRGSGRTACRDPSFSYHTLVVDPG